MLNNLRQFNRRYRLIEPGDSIICAVSGGADSMALLWALYLLKDEWRFRLSAAHFNHNLRKAESDADADFVREFCESYRIPFYAGSGQVIPGKKGLEAAAREARYAFLCSLPGKIATAHTADDNAETVLLHLVRGTGLKGLGGIAPVNGRVIRPMLNVTRKEVTAFLDAYRIPHREDSSNGSDAFLRNRLRHKVIPLLREENPRLCENLSAMALGLRQDEDALSRLSVLEFPPAIAHIREMPPALRARALDRFLKESGVREPERSHIAQAEALVFSKNPSALAHFPGGVTIRRNYGVLERAEERTGPEWKFVRVPAGEILNTPFVFTVVPQGHIYLRPRRSGDTIRLPGGSRSLKKLFIDRKIPAQQRASIPIVCDDGGILGIPGIGVNLDRAAQALPAVQIRFDTEKGVPTAPDHTGPSAL